MMRSAVLVSTIFITHHGMISSVASLKSEKCFPATIIGEVLLI